MFKEKVIHHRMTTQLVVQVHMYISEVVLGLLVLDATATVVAKTCHSFWSNYGDLTRPGPPNGGLVREIPGYFREICWLVKYYSPGSQRP